MGTGRLLYFPLLAWWGFLHLPEAQHLPYFIFLALGLAIQAWSFPFSTAREGNKPGWLPPVSILWEVLALFPPLVYGESPGLALFFALIPMGGAHSLHGTAASFFTLLAGLAAGFLGAWMRMGLSAEWTPLSLSGLLIAASFYSLVPLVEAARKTVRRFSMVEGLARHLEAASDRQAILQWLVENITTLFHTEFGAIYLWDEKLGKLKLQASSGKIFHDASKDPLELAFGNLEWVAKEGKPYVANDLSLDPRYAHHRGERPAVVSLACVPVGKRSGMRGAFVCGSTLLSPFSPSDTEVLMIFSRYITLVLDQESANQGQQRLLHELEALHASCAALTSKLELEEILHLIAGFTLQLLDVKDWTLFLFEPQKKEFFGYLSTTAFTEEIHGLRLTWGEGAISQAILKKEMLMIPDLSKNPLVSEKENRGGRFLSMLVLPLFHQERVLGAVQISDTLPRTFSDEEVRFAGSLGALVSLALSRSPAPLFLPSPGD